MLRDYHQSWEHDIYTSQRSPGGFVVVGISKSFKLWEFYCGPELTIVLLAVPFAARARRMLFALLTLGFVLLGLSLATYLFVHYLAPLTSVCFMLLGQGMRGLYVSKWNNIHYGRAPVLAICALCLISSVPPLLVRGVAAPHPVQPWYVHRGRLRAELEADGNRHLVVVRYSHDHSPHFEWVYNEADIDSAKVVWAREMGPARDRKLLEYFKGRQFWTFEPDRIPLRLVPYESTEDSG